MEACRRHDVPRLVPRSLDMPAANSYKVLVVEDEGLIAHDIATRLQALGHQVIGTVATAQEAIAQAGAADLVLMDIASTERPMALPRRRKFAPAIAFR